MKILTWTFTAGKPVEVVAALRERHHALTAPTLGNVISFLVAQPKSASGSMVRRHARVGVNLHKLLARRGLDGPGVWLGAGEGDRFGLGARRLLTDEAGEALVLQRAHAVWPLPVSHRHLVIERSRVAVSTAREVSVIVGYQFSRGGTIELGDDDRAPRGARSGQGAGELWAALEDELAEDGQALRGKSARHRLVGSLP